MDQSLLMYRNDLRNTPSIRSTKICYNYNLDEGQNKAKDRSIERATNQ